jgi:cytochrome oxidase Cu insertion factor (SCO1/SenC/PrrC family)
METKSIVPVMLSLFLTVGRSEDKGIVPQQPLADAHGNFVRLSDFKGKIIVLDFWFTGCINCMKFFRGGLSIAERHFMDDSSVVFISICIDKDKNTWRSSLEKGKYASKESVNLYTNGMGEQHPVVKAFQVVSYPQPIVLDRKGGVISRSDSLTEANKLIGVIEAGLRK